MKRFQGRVRSKNPKNLIKPEGKNDLDDLFLSLALIYNDLKDIISFQDLIDKTYEPLSSAKEAHDGELGGIKIHIIRMASGIINEFLELLRENKSVQSEEVSSIINGLKPDSQKLWQDLMSISDEKPNISGDSTLYAISMIRGNISAHYKNAGKNLRTGFINRFHKKKGLRGLKNEAAYYSLEDNIERTRFYYADAAAEEYMVNISNDWDKYMADVNELVKGIHTIIYFLMKDYLKDKV